MQKNYSAIAATVICGASGFVALMWTPKSKAGLTAYGVLLVIVVLSGLVLFQRRRKQEAKRQEDH